MAERNIIMKNGKKIISAILSCAMALSMCAGTALSVSAAGDCQEEESTYSPNSTVGRNDTFEQAEIMQASWLYDKTYTRLVGNFVSGENHIDKYDFYKFSTKKTTGNSGRVAITLDGIPVGHDYDLYLYDANKKLIASSTNEGNKKEIVKTPAILTTTSYYLEVRAETIPDDSQSNYYITVGDYIKTKTTTVSLSPRELTAKSNQWSSDAYGKTTLSVPADAVIVTAKISATRGSANNSANNVLRVKNGKNGQYISVTWTTGDIEVTELAGQKCNNDWYAGFKATELPLLSVGPNSYLGFVSMYTFKVTITYEYAVL